MTLVAGLLAGAISGWTSAVATSPSEMRGTIELPEDLARRVEDGSVLFGGEELPLEYESFTVEGIPGRVGLLEVVDSVGRVVAARVLPQSEDWRYLDANVDLRSTAAAVVMTAPGVASADPYLDLVLLAALEEAPLLDTAAALIERAARDDPDWYDRRLEILAGVLPQLVEQALDGLEAAWSTSDEPGDAPAAAGRGRIPDIQLASFETTPVARPGAPVRPSCDGSAMGDVDGLERDGVCFFPASPPVSLDDADGTQMFVAENRTARWVVVFGGEAAIPVALIPPKRWAVPHARTLTRLIAEASTTTGPVSWFRERLEAVGVEYLREDATFLQKLELALAPYLQAPLTYFTVPGGLLADGLTTVAFGTPDVATEDDPRVVAGVAVSTYLTLTTEILAPTMAIAMNVRRTADVSNAEPPGADVPRDSCLAGLEPDRPDLGGSLLDILVLPPDRALSEPEIGCRLGRVLRMTVVDRLLEFALDNEAIVRVANEDLSRATSDASAMAVIRASVGILQSFATAMTDSEVIGSILAVELFGDDVGVALGEAITEELLAEFSDFSISVGRRALGVPAASDAAPTRNPFRIISAAAQDAVTASLTEILARRASTRLAANIAAQGFRTLLFAFRVEEFLNLAIDAVNVGLTVGQLYVDVQEFGVRDVYTPLMLTAMGDPILANLPAFPEVLWTTETGIVPDDTTELRSGDGEVRLWQRLLTDEYGLLIALDGNGALTPASTSQRVRATVSDGVLVLSGSGSTHRFPLSELFTAAGIPPEDHGRALNSMTPGFREDLGTGRVQVSRRGLGGRPYAVTVRGVDPIAELFGLPRPPGLAVAIDQGGRLLTSAWVPGLQQVGFTNEGRLLAYAGVEEGTLVTEIDEGGRRRTTYGPSSINGQTILSIDGERFVHYRIDGAGPAQAFPAGSPRPLWRVPSGTSCPLVDGAEATGDGSSTCRRVDRWYAAGDLLVAAFVQGGFEVRETATGGQLLVDAADWGAAITAVERAGDLLFLGDSRGTIRVIDLAVERGDRTGRLGGAAIRLGAGGSLAPIVDVAVRGDELYVASNTTRRLVRFRQRHDGVWGEDWTFPIDRVVDVHVDASAAYVLRDDGSVTAIR